MRYSMLMVAMAVTLAGCDGGADGRTEVYKITGKVTVGGTTPAAGVAVSFAPLNGQPTAFGKTEDDGSLVITTYAYNDGAAEGEYEVLITAVEVNNAATPSSGSHDAMQGGGGAPTHDAKSRKGGGVEKSIINEKYSKKGNGLTAKVTAAGPNEFNFDLDP